MHSPTLDENSALLHVPVIVKKAGLLRKFFGANLLFVVPGYCISPPKLKHKPLASMPIACLRSRV